MSTQTVAPERSYAQRMEALAKANDIRSHRAEIKTGLKRRRVSVRDVLMSEDPKMASMKLLTLLLAVPKVGRVKAHKILGQSKCSPSKTVGGLSGRQRREVLALLPSDARVSLVD